MRSAYGMIILSHKMVFEDMPDILQVLSNIHRSVENMFNERTSRPVDTNSLRQRVIRLRTPMSGSTPPASMPPAVVPPAENQRDMSAADRRWSGFPNRSGLVVEEMAQHGLFPHPGCKFGMETRLVHKKTRGLYVVVGLPTHVRLENTDKPAYAYLGEDGMIWVRDQVEMEDGRFQEFEEYERAQCQTT